jgi:Raf kinase inhibitor-like YbhB/YbcL family protein
MNINENIGPSLPHDGVNRHAGHGRSVHRQPTRSRTLAALSLAAAFVAAALAGFGGSEAYAATPKFTLSSPDLASGKFETRFTLNGFGCTGANVSPSLQWSNLPAGTKSLSLQVHDLDAPTGSGLWHWAVYNIPPTAAGLAQGAGNSPSALPAPAFGGATDFLDTGVTGINGNYGGPCPSVGDKPHRYVFTLYAVAVDDVQAAAGIPKTGTPALYSFVLNKGLGSKLLGTASFTALYGR